MQPLVFHQNCILSKNVMKYREMQQKNQVTSHSPEKNCLP